jgi:hypothetical protein
MKLWLVLREGVNWNDLKYEVHEDGDEPKEEPELKGFCKQKNIDKGIITPAEMEMLLKFEILNSEHTFTPGGWRYKV